MNNHPEIPEEPSDLIGIIMPNGFDISGNRHEMATWARISRADRVKVRREFDATNNAFHTLHATFTINEVSDSPEAKQSPNMQTS